MCEPILLLRLTKCFKRSWKRVASATPCRRDVLRYTTPCILELGGLHGWGRKQHRIAVIGRHRGGPQGLEGFLFLCVCVNPPIGRARGESLLLLNVTLDCPSPVLCFSVSSLAVKVCIFRPGLCCTVLYCIESMQTPKLFGPRVLTAQRSEVELKGSMGGQFQDQHVT